jgi:hypothetical protein
LSQLNFNYAPLPGFDTRKGQGRIASLLAPMPEDHVGALRRRSQQVESCTTFSWRTNAWVRTSLCAAGTEQDPHFQNFCRGKCCPYLLTSLRTGIFVTIGMRSPDYKPQMRTIY